MPFSNWKFENLMLHDSWFSFNLFSCNTCSIAGWWNGTPLDPSKILLHQTYDFRFCDHFMLTYKNKTPKNTHLIEYLWGYFGGWHLFLVYYSHCFCPIGKLRSGREYTNQYTKLTKNNIFTDSDTTDHVSSWKTQGLISAQTPIQPPGPNLGLRSSGHKRIQGYFTALYYCFHNGVQGKAQNIPRVWHEEIREYRLGILTCVVTYMSLLVSGCVLTNLKAIS